MVLQRWYPFAEIRRMNRAFNRPWDDRGRAIGYDDGRWNIPVDVAQEGDDIVVRASVPGLKPEDIAVTLEDGLLTIEGETASESKVNESDYLLRERRVGRFRRALRLPDTVDAGKAQPSYENGVLTIAVPKQESRKAKRLEIKTD